MNHINTNNPSKNNNFCNNCGKQGHLFHQCKLPITSYGIILFRHSDKGLQFLMIRRKDSFGYIDIIRGKYTPYHLEQIQNSINEMSISEKERLLKEPFDKLWRMMWGDDNIPLYRNEEMLSSKKFEIIKNGIKNTSTNTNVTLQDLIENSDTFWEETEWEFPKGRRNYQEKDLDCALREFQEETGYSYKNISIIENVLPFEELFIGSNHKSYKHKYFLACLNETADIENMENYQKSEVSKIEWKSLEECLQCIRPYNLEKKKIINNIYKILQEYRLYS
jgi:8-oxo-dGTP pyrophosphatase MutT (NUDIX family)